MDFYVILGVERGATLGDIKRAYKRLARKYHPDINPGDRMAAAQFRQIAEAYETLSDPDRRRRYDTTGVARPTPRRRDVRLRRVRLLGQRAAAASAPTFGDLFADVLQPARGAARRRARRSAAPICIRRSRSTSRRRCAAASARSRSRGRSTAVTCSGTGRLHVAETRCLQCHGIGRREVGARPHGVLEAVRALRRHRAGSADALSGVRRPAGRDADRVADDQHAAGPGRRRAHPRAGQGARRAATAARTAICTSRSTCSRIRCSGATATIST